MKILNWKISEALISSPEVTNRNALAKKWHKSKCDQILNQYIKMSAKEAEFFYSQIFNLFPNIDLKGVGIELGSGIGILSVIAANQFKNIQKIYTVELVPDVVRLLQTRILNDLAPHLKSKIQPVIGSFDDIDLPNQSLDFSLEFASLHHSQNLDKTLKELARVLKPGGFLLAIDRAHHNSLSEEQANFMLNVEYSNSWKVENGYALDRLSRRQNGEHEFSLKKWEHAFKASGFIIESRKELKRLGFKMLLRALLLTIPFRCRKFLKIFPSRTQPKIGEIIWRVKSLFGLHKHDIFFHSSHDYTVFLVRRSR